LRAVLDEYARAIRGYESVLLAIPADRYIARTVLSDDHFANIKAIAAHTVGAAHSYAFHINRAIDKLDGPIPKRESAVDTPQIAIAALWEAFDHMVEVLGRIKDWGDDQQAEVRFISRWKQPYDIEQMLEHAIVHILRHRRQIERWLLAELA
jgi:uncharacterized damage-inducible protein DinB